MNSVETPRETRIVVIVAGMNEPSNSDFLAERFIEGIREVPGVQVSKFRIKDLHIQHFNLDCYEESCALLDDFGKVEPALKDCHGIVIATPIWNFSVPAHLKNFIDRMGCFALDFESHSKGQLQGRPCYFIYTGGAPMIAWKALMYLTTLHVIEAFKYYGAAVIGRHFEPKSVAGRGKFGLVVDKRPESIAKMRRLGKRFGEIAMHYAENGSLPLSSKLAYKFFTFLYRVGNRIMYPISTLQ